MKKLCLAFLLLCLCMLKGRSQSCVEVFTYHPMGRPVLLFQDTSCTEIGAALFPLYSEYIECTNDMVGYIVHIVADCGCCFRLDSDGMGLFIRKGDVAINTRNYDEKELFLYANPNIDSLCVNMGKGERTLRVWGISDNWIYTEIEENGSIIKGWIPPEMICGNPFTPCC